MIQLAENLREEKSRSVSLSADIYHRWETLQGNFLVEGFKDWIHNTGLQSFKISKHHFIQHLYG